MPEASDDGLSHVEAVAVERMLADANAGAGARGTRVRGAEVVWGRRHLLRVRTDGDPVIVKRAKLWDDGALDRASLRAEVAALALCAGTHRAVAPRLLGFDTQLDLLVMEDLAGGRSLADLLLTGDAATATEGVREVARGIAGIHAATARRETDYLELTGPLGIGARSWKSWLEKLSELQDTFMAVLATEGISLEGLRAEVAGVHERLTSSPLRGLVHGDLCPDNVSVGPSGARLFDFEGSFFGPFAIDVGFLVAPFPGCWCFAELPREVSTAARFAYEEEMARLGADLGASWAVDLAAALACFVIVRVAALPEASEADREWGTTTMRPRLLSWLERLADDDVASGAYPRLCAAAARLFESLLLRWPDSVRLGYPAFAEGGEPTVVAPAFWAPGL